MDKRREFLERVSALVNQLDRMFYEYNAGAKGKYYTDMFEYVLSGCGGEIKTLNEENERLKEVIKKQKAEIAYLERQCELFKEMTITRDEEIKHKQKDIDLLKEIINKLN